MKAFAYLTPDSFESASAALAQSDALAKAAGTDLLDLLKERVLEPDELLNLQALGAKGEPLVQEATGGAQLSSLATLSFVGANPWIQKEFPALQQAASEAATPQIRNVGTVGGNLCQTSRCPYLRNRGFECFKRGDAACAALKPGAHTRNHAIYTFPLCACAHPSNLAPALTALEAKVICVHPDGERTIDMEELYRGPLPNQLGDTTLRKGELIKAIRLDPSPLTRNSTYVELRERESFDFAICSVAAAAHVEGGKVRKARIVCGGVASTPRRAKKAEAALIGKALDAKSIAAAAQAAVEGAKPLAQNGHKVVILERLVSRALGALKA